LKIAIEVRVDPGIAGGVGPALRSLISALGTLTDGPEEYLLVLSSEELVGWLGALGANQRTIVLPSARPRPLWRRALSPVVQGARKILAPARRWPEVGISDGFYEGLGCDVVHFPTHAFTVCCMPSVYNPHDLQHLHYPQFFTPAEIAWRETTFPAGCHFAQTVIVNSQWVKNDVVRQYGVSPHKVQVIPEAAATQFLPATSNVDLTNLKERYGLPETFAFYPSMTWPHKNHVRLLDTLAYLRDRRALTVHLVCSGARHEASWPQIQSRIAQHNLGDQVHFLGFLPQDHLRGLYRLARCLVLPTLFEANSLPIFEAWLEGTPVACSNVTALPEQVMDAGVLFDPMDPIAIGDAIATLFTDDRMCEELRAKGRRRLGDFDWARTAKAYRAVYRRSAGQRLSEEDRKLLEWDWMRSPRPSAET
jgi:glycosyltransferase involved in cell wall biosynthesis